MKADLFWHYTDRHPAIEACNAILPISYGDVLPCLTHHLRHHKPPCVGHTHIDTPPVTWLLKAETVERNHYHTGWHKYHARYTVDCEAEPWSEFARRHGAPKIWLEAPRTKLAYVTTEPITRRQWVKREIMGGYKLIYPPPSSRLTTLSPISPPQLRRSMTPGTEERRPQSR